MWKSILSFCIAAFIAQSVAATTVPLTGAGKPISAAFPAVQSSATTVSSGNVTSLAVNLPSGIVSGDLLLMCGYVSDNGRNPAPPTGWTAELYDTTVGSGELFCEYKLPASGSEGATVTLSLGSSSALSVVVYRISPASAISAGTVNTSTKDPPSFTPAGGAKNYLWIAHVGTRFSVAPTWTAPTGFGNLQQINNSTGNTTSTALSTLQLNAATEDPATYTNTGTISSTGSNTLAVAP